MIKKLRYRKWKKIIEKSGLFDVKYYLFTYPDVRLKDINPIMHYIKYGANEGRNPNKEFDTSFYLTNYSDVKESKMNPLVHYILYGIKENRIISSLKLEKNIAKQTKEQELSQTKQNLQTNKKISNDIDVMELIDYINITDKDKNVMKNFIKAKINKINIKNVFSSEDYLEMYPDIKASGVNPLKHYLLNGKKEGRLPFIDIEKYVLEGNKSFDKSKKTIMLVSHESSATGAPLLGLNIGKKLTEKYNLIHYVMRKSNIHDIFYEDCFLLIEEFDEKYPLVGKIIIEKINDQYNIKSVVCNSIVTYPILEIASDLKIPTLSLIHEFSEYTKPKDRMLNNIIAADSVILPAKIIQNSIMEQLNKIAGISTIPSNIHIYPQGKLTFLPNSYGNADSPNQILKKLNIHNKDEYKIIVASGYAQIRKGVDLFIYTAKYIKNNYQGKCKFVWVGDGFNPDTDASYALWLDREIKHLGLEKDFVFLEHQQSLESIFSIADIFCLTSRMDPFPNVVIDALEANLPIACFRDASGSVEFLEENNAECIIADYLDVHQLGEMISNYLIKNLNKKETNSLLVKEKLNFDNYMHFLYEQIEEANRFNAENLKIHGYLSDTEYFDNEYVNFFELKSKSIYYYILLHRKGMPRMASNPFTGFSNLKYTIENKSNKNEVPLYEALKKKIYSTHECKIVPFETRDNLSIRLAVHLHLYYIDLSQEFIDYFKSLPKGYDLFISIIDENSVDEVEEKFKDSGAKNIKVVVVENIGRDVAPMIFDLKDEILNNHYDVIGHFHSKKSISTDSDLGNRWRKYLLDNLIGDEKIAKSILSLFDDKNIGLVFAEDRHYMDIGENKTFFDELCQKMEIEKIEETPLFPLGNMFWARVEAIRQLFHLNRDEILQQEPLPYDGSFMHAIERITPNLVKNNNFKFVTVYKRGSKW